MRGRDRDLIIDTGMVVANLKDFASAFLDKPVTAIATHVHLDHIGSHYEFDECCVHALEEEGLRNPSRASSLGGTQFDPMDVATLNIPHIEGYDMSGPMLTSIPFAGFDISHHAIKAQKVINTLYHGDTIDLGDRLFQVMHLPGHSPGGIGLWEARTETLFSGDAIYDGPLIDTLHHSNVTDYKNTMLTLLELPAKTVHAGHDPSFGRDRLLELANGYLRSQA